MAKIISVVFTPSERSRRMHNFLVWLLLSLGSILSGGGVHLIRHFGRHSKHIVRGAGQIGQHIVLHATTQTVGKVGQVVPPAAVSAPLAPTAAQVPANITPANIAQMQANNQRNQAFLNNWKGPLQAPQGTATNPIEVTDPANLY